MNTNIIDWKKIRYLLRLGFFAACLVLLGDMKIGAVNYYYDAPGIPAVFARVMQISDERIISSAIYGLIGIPIECLCWFSIYRVIKPYSDKYARIYRAGILGCLAFGACGVHVPCCMAAFLLKRFYDIDASLAYENVKIFVTWFLLPATLIFLVFFFMTGIVQIMAFIKGNTPLPRWCWIFNVLMGVPWIIIMRLIGDYPITNGLAAAWISVGNLWMFGGLLVMTRDKK